MTDFISAVQDVKRRNLDFNSAESCEFEFIPIIIAEDISGAFESIPHETIVNCVKLMFGFNKLSNSQHAQIETKLPDLVSSYRGGKIMPLLPLFGCPWGHEKKWQKWPTGHFCHFFCPSETLKKSGKSGQLAIFATFLPVGTRKKVAKVANWPFLPLFFCPSKILKKVARFSPPALSLYDLLILNQNWVFLRTKLLLLFYFFQVNLKVFK